MHYHTITEARSLPGTRLILTAGVPGPWGEAAKAIFRIRKVPYVPVAQEIAGSNDEQMAWLGIRNAPVAVHNDERPRSGWAEILFLAERLGSGPSLIPNDAAERALMIGLSYELAGENGLGWSRRLNIVSAPLEEGPSSPAYGFAKFFGDNYGYTPEAGRASAQRCVDILAMLSQQIEKQQAAGKRYLVGDSLSAADVYWACFANLVDPLPNESCPMGDDIRALYGSASAPIKAAVSPALIAHRDFICQTAVGLPFEF